MKTKLVVIAALAAIALVVLVGMLSRSKRQDGGQDQTDLRRTQGQSRASTANRLPEPTLAPGAAPPDFLTPTPRVPLTEVQIKQVMTSWQQAITARDAEGVERIDSAFRAQPDEYLPAIMDCAEAHEVAQVRAFCTRVLGNLRRPAAAPRLRGMLADQHEFVRHNAAWALAELNDKQAAGLLDRLSKSDRSKLVRETAAESVRRLREDPQPAQP